MLHIQETGRPTPSRPQVLLFGSGSDSREFHGAWHRRAMLAARPRLASALSISVQQIKSEALREDGAVVPGPLGLLLQ